MHDVSPESVVLLCIVFFVAGILYDRFVLLPLAIRLTAAEDRIRDWLDGHRAR